MEILKVENLTKIYGEGNNKVVALDNVSFTVEKGEFLAIVGASGSGKSTLLHLLGGVDKPTKGKVYVDGKDIYELSDDNLAIFRRREVGLIYQFYNLIPILNVEENITLPLELDNRKVDEEDLKQVINNLGLSKRKKHLWIRAMRYGPRRSRNDKQSRDRYKKGDRLEKGESICLDG